MEALADGLGADEERSQLCLAQGQGAQNIVTRDNARDAAIPDHRDALDPVSDEHARYLAQLGIFAHCDNRR